MTEALREEDGLRRATAIVLIATMACSHGEGALTGRVYMAAVPEVEVVGSWGLAVDQQAVLQLRADHSCSATPAIVEYFIKCEQAYPAVGQPLAPCSWTVERSGPGDGVVVTFNSPSNVWLSTQLGAYRHVERHDVALLGTCGSGDAYGLYHVPQATP